MSQMFDCLDRVFSATSRFAATFESEFLDSMISDISVISKALLSKDVAMRTSIVKRALSHFENFAFLLQRTNNSIIRTDQTTLSLKTSLYRFMRNLCAFNITLQERFASTLFQTTEFLDFQLEELIHPRGGGHELRLTLIKAILQFTCNCVTNCELHQHQCWILLQNPGRLESWTNSFAIFFEHQVYDLSKSETITAQTTFESLLALLYNTTHNSRQRQCELAASFRVWAHLLDAERFLQQNTSFCNEPSSSTAWLSMLQDDLVIPRYFASVLPTISVAESADLNMISLFPRLLCGILSCENANSNPENSNPQTCSSLKFIDVSVSNYESSSLCATTAARLCMLLDGLQSSIESLNRLEKIPPDATSIDSSCAADVIRHRGSFVATMLTLITLLRRVLPASSLLASRGEVIHFDVCVASAIVREHWSSQMIEWGREQTHPHFVAQAPPIVACNVSDVAANANVRTKVHSGMFSRQNLSDAPNTTKTTCALWQLEFLYTLLELLGTLSAVGWFTEPIDDQYVDSELVHNDGNHAEHGRYLRCNTDNPNVTSTHECNLNMYSARRSPQQRAVDAGLMHLAASVLLAANVVDTIIQAPIESAEDQARAFAISGDSGERTSATLGAAQMRRQCQSPFALKSLALRLVANLALPSADGIAAFERQNMQIASVTNSTCCSGVVNVHTHPSECRNQAVGDSTQDSILCEHANEAAHSLAGHEWLYAWRLTPWLLQLSVLDDRQPMAREWALLALRNACLAHRGNQSLVAALEFRGVTPEAQTELQRMGLQTSEHRNGDGQISMGVRSTDARVNAHANSGV